MRRLLAALAILLTSTACSAPDSDLPAEYRRIDVPRERLHSSEAIARGRTLYEKNCILCHGKGGNGHGRRSAGLSKKPARFADPRWREGTTPRHVYFVVQEGVPGTPMPSWDWLGEDETWDLVAYVLSLGQVGRRGGDS
jgi:mono/diheme cytochrome c family protein